MELALPLIALGGMYVISNQNNNNIASSELGSDGTGTPRYSQSLQQNQPATFKENFGTMTAHGNNSLPNVNVPVENYPVISNSQMSDTVNEYHGQNTATGNYFNQNIYNNKSAGGSSVKQSQNIPKIYSLTGDYLDSSNFSHNNMVPFNSGKVNGTTYNMDMSESTLDNMTGAGNNVIQKKVLAPMFKPEKDMQWSHGMPNHSEFFQSRVTPGMSNNNVKPFESIMVAPGLNNGFSAEGSNGFNSGMESIDKWMPKSVDELRVETNPKLSFGLGGHEGPSMSSIKNPASTVTQGRVEKHLPDTYFINSQDRWLTTTGAEKGSTRRSIQDTGNVKRPDCPTNYSGPAGNAENPSTYAPKNFEPSRRPEFGAPEVPASNAAGKGPSTDGDGFIKSYTNYTNNRATTTTASPFGIVGTMVSAAMAPIMDVLNPTRKEETIHNARLYGDVGSSVANSYVINKNETAPTTVKETTLTSTQFNINNQSEGQYVNNAVAPDATQRDTTGCSHIGSSGGVGTSTGNMVYNAAYSQTNNDIKSSTIHNRQNQGGTQMFNQNMNLTTVPADTTRFDGRVNPPSSIVTYSPAVESYGNVNTPQSFSQESDSSRIDPNLLSAFKKNPYTHSLTGVV